MTDRLLRPFAAWSVTAIAILVALGLQTLLEATIPASIANLEFGWPDRTVIFHAGSGQFWIAESFIRLVSFFVGGYVGGRLTVAVRHRVLVVLAAAAAVVTLFQQLPGPGPVFWWALWALVAPLSIVVGAYAAHLKRHTV